MSDGRCVMRNKSMKLERREIEKEKSRRERGKEIVRSKRERESKTYV